MQVIFVFLTVLAVVIVAGGLLLGWSRITRSPELKSMLRNFALYGGGMLLILTAALTFTMATCSGDIIYGMDSCAVMSTQAADLIIMFNLIGNLTAILAFGLVVLFGIVMEILARCRSNA